MKTTEQFKYKAFISYSHAADGKVAPALQSALHQFAKPWYKLRAMRMFRDETNLAVNPHLWSNIVEALDDSEFFILLASPQVAQSSWVPKEVEHWLSKRPPETLLIVLTDGEIVWDQAAGDFNWTKTTALPRNLSKVFSEEPLYLDFRSMRTQADLSLRNPDFLSKIARLAAPLHGRSLDDLIGEDVQQHRKFKLFTRSMVTALAGLWIAALAAAWYANVQRNAAEERAKIALSRLLAAQAFTHLDHQLDLAMLLSVQAYLTYSTAEAYGSLLAALEHSPNLITYLYRSTGSVGSLAFSPDGKVIAIADCVNLVKGEDCKQSSIRLFDIKTRQQVASSLEGRASQINGLAFSADGKMLASAGTDGAVTLWDTSTWKLLGDPLIHHTKSLTSVAFSPDNSFLAAGGADGTILLLRIGVQQAVIQREHGLGPVRSLAFSPNSKKLASGGDESFIVLWSVQGDTVTGDRRLYGEPVQSLAFYAGPNGDLLLAASIDAAVTVWNISNKDPAGQKFSVHNEYLASAAFSRHGTTLTVGTKDASLLVLDIEGRARLNVPRDERDNSVGELLRQESVEMDSLRPFIGHAFPVQKLALSDDGKLLTSAGKDGVIILWNATRIRPLVQSLPFDTSRIASTAADPKSKSAVPSQCRPRDGEPECSVSPDGKIMARVETIPIRCAPGAEEKGCVHVGIRLWETATGFPIGPALIEDTYIPPFSFDQKFHIEFIAEGKVRVSSEETESIFEWTIHPNALQDHACSIANRNLTAQEWRQYLGDEPYRKTCPNMP